MGGASSIPDMPSWRTTAVLVSGHQQDYGMWVRWGKLGSATEDITQGVERVGIVDAGFLEGLDEIVD